MCTTVSTKGVNDVGKSLAGTAWTIDVTSETAIELALFQVGIVEGVETEMETRTGTMIIGVQGGDVTDRGHLEVYTVRFMSEMEMVTSMEIKMQGFRGHFDFGRVELGEWMVG